MTKKDYVLIADAIREAREGYDLNPDPVIQNVINSVAERVADKLQADNPRFNRQRFMDATR